MACPLLLEGPGLFLLQEVLTAKHTHNQFSNFQTLSVPGSLLTLRTCRRVRPYELGLSPTRPPPLQMPAASPNPPDPMAINRGFPQPLSLGLTRCQNGSQDSRKYFADN